MKMEQVNEKMIRELELKIEQVNLKMEQVNRKNNALEMRVKELEKDADCLTDNIGNILINAALGYNVADGFRAAYANGNIYDVEAMLNDNQKEA